MDHGLTKRQCPHNRCLDHDPKFGPSKKETADFKPSRLFKILIYFKYFCCKKTMKVKLIHLTEVCELCGRKKSEPHEYKFICECCDFHKNFGKRAFNQKRRAFAFAVIFGALSIFSFLSIFILAFSGSPWFGLATFFCTIFIVISVILACFISEL